MDTENSKQTTPLVLWPKENEEAQRAFLAGMELCRLIAVQRAAMCCSGIPQPSLAEGVELGAAQIAQRIHSSMSMLAPHVGKVEGEGGEEQRRAGPGGVVPSEEDLEAGCRIEIRGVFEAKRESSARSRHLILRDGQHIFEVHEDLVGFYSVRDDP